MAVVGEPGKGVAEQARPHHQNPATRPTPAGPDASTTEHHITDLNVYTSASRGGASLDVLAEPLTSKPWSSAGPRGQSADVRAAFLVAGRDGPVKAGLQFGVAQSEGLNLIGVGGDGVPVLADLGCVLRS